MAADKEGPSTNFKRAVTIAMRRSRATRSLRSPSAASSPASPVIAPGCRRCRASSSSARWLVVRGLADSLSLRLANHSDEVHSKYRPAGRSARAVFEAV